MAYMLILLLTTLLYLPTLTFDLVIDDIEWRRNVTTPTWFQCHPWYYRLYGVGPFLIYIEHAITLCLHLTTVALLYVVVNPIAALLFAVHPSNNQTAIWLNGRRYSILNIIVLILALIHMLWLLVLIAIPIAIFGYNQLSTRRALNVPSGIYTPASIARCLYFTALKLTGLIHYSFRYPYGNTAPYLPHTQPIAERYISIPLLVVCSLLSLVPISFLLVPIYILRTIQLMPMYIDIQHFYNYHRRLYPDLEKLTLIKRLYDLN